MRTGRFLFVLLVLSTSASAQITTPTPAPPIPEHTGLKEMVKELGEDVYHLWSTENLMWTGIGAGGALAIHPVDDTANQTLSGPSLDKFFKPGAVLGESYTLIPVSVAIYAIGRSRNNTRMSHMGSDLIQSLLIAELLTQSLKYATRRERPDLSNNLSFPSGHAADTLAFATAIERHFNWKYWAPAYAFATYVAMSRLHDNRHWASDVVFGSTVGVIAGRTVTRLGHKQFPVAVTPVPGGVFLAYAPSASAR